MTYTRDRFDQNMRALLLSLEGEGISGNIGQHHLKKVRVNDVNGVYSADEKLSQRNGYKDVIVAIPYDKINPWPLVSNVKPIEISDETGEIDLEGSVYTPKIFDPESDGLGDNVDYTTPTVDGRVLEE